MSGEGALAPLLPPREAYTLWAPTYEEENALSTLDEHAVSRLTPALPGRTLLDAGCGTARRLSFLPASGPRRALGIDLVPAMLARGRRRISRTTLLLAGDLQRLPVAPASFDVVWCRLAAGHVDSLAVLYAELARAARSGAAVVVTDFHPEAARRGHVRSFRDGEGRGHLVAHVVHEPSDHERAARAAGLRCEERLDLAVGPEVRRFYEAAGALERFTRDEGLKVLAAFRFRAG